LDKPSPQASTIRDRNANTCDDFARRDHRSNCSRSSSVSTSAAFGRPAFAIPRIMLHSNAIRVVPGPHPQDNN
jgi:hypothetical protein